MRAKANRAAAGEPRLALQVQLASRRRRGVPHVRSLRAWANAAYEAHVRRSPAKMEMTVRVVDAAESRQLNRDWRGKNKPTNVLSFPMGAMPGPVEERRLLGDLVICASVVMREAREQRKGLSAHWAHMVVHGVLHLLGYDHENDRDARVMETREIAVLRRFGIADPYGASV